MGGCDGPDRDEMIELKNVAFNLSTATLSAIAPMRPGRDTDIFLSSLLRTYSTEFPRTYTVVAAQSGVTG